MKKFLNKAKAALDDRHAPQQPLVPEQDNPAASLPPPTPTDIVRYRYHHGANLGSVFILERWLTGSMFHEATQGSSELGSVSTWLAKEGLEATRARFERHWRDYVSDADLDWLRDVARCTTVRVPVGYFTLGPAYCQGTPFERVGAVYEHAWSAVRDLVGRCWQRGIGVLVDMHGLPGGANGQDHSGTDGGKAELWGSRGNQEKATRALCFAARQLQGLEGVAGLQIINEAEHNARGMYDWYDETLKELSKIDSSLPIYVSDAWDLGRAVDWAQKRNTAAGSLNPIVIDTHLYWCFSDADQAKTPQQISNEAGGKLSELDGKDGSVVDRGAAQAVIGEYSCVLGEGSWSKGGNTPKDDLVREFGHAESRRFQQRTGGSFFWTYRMDWMPGGEWGFRQMTESQAIQPPPSLTLDDASVQQRLAHADSQRQSSRDQAVSGHCHFWDTNHPGAYEHWRFEKGWDVGFSDAAAFYGMRTESHVPGADTIGMLDLWCLKRVRDSGHGGKFVWEFEQGLRQGIQGFGSVVGA